jgi:hypothetical protein
VWKDTEPRGLILATRLILEREILKVDDGDIVDSKVRGM